MISLHSIIKTTTPSMKIQSKRTSVMNINNKINSSSQFNNFIGKSMFQRINSAPHKCASCPNSR